MNQPVLSAALLCGSLFVSCNGFAQDILAPPPQYSVTPPGAEQPQNQMEVFSRPGIVPLADNPPLAQWGPVSLRPHLFYRMYYGDGIPAAGTNYVNTTIQEISPGLFLGLGDHWSIDYTPTLRYYSSGAFRDTLDHSARLTGGTTYEDWSLGFVQGYDRSSAPLVETGAQTDLETFSTDITASYRFNSKMWVDLSVNQTVLGVINQSTLTNTASGGDLNEYWEWSTEDWLNYQFYEHLDSAVGVTFGFVDQSEQPDAFFERVQGRMRWRAMEKVSLHVRGGVEVREFLSGDQDSVVNPLAGAAIQYQPLDVTRLSLDFDHTVTASYLQSPSIESTAIMASLNQRLLEILYLDLSGGFRMVQYAASTTSPERNDDYYLFNARLSTNFLKRRGTAAIFYQYSDNASTEPGFTFDSSQVGFELGYRY